jgi:uncharacterized membrane protein YbhN (UPF0104 family)
MTAPPPSRRKVIFRIAITVILLGGGIGAVSTLHGMDWRAFGGALAGVALVPLAIGLVVSTLQVFAQLLRFYVLVPDEVMPPLWELLDATAIGQLLNYATPLRAGDAYKLLRLAPAPAGEAKTGRFGTLLAALLVERAADVIGLFVMAAWASFAELQGWWLSVMPSAGTAWKVAGAAVVVAVVLAVLARRLPRIFGSFFGSVWGAARSPRFAASIGVALVTWTLDAGTLFWTTRAGGYPLSFRETMQSVFVLNLGIAMPITVGNIGVFEAALAFALTRHGVPAERALAIATIEHFAKFSGLGLCVGLLRLARVTIWRPAATGTATPASLRSAGDPGRPRRGKTK